MTADTKLIHLRLLEHPRIRRAVRCVARGTAFKKSLMLVNKGTLLFTVTVEADNISGGVRSKLLGTECSVRTMAIIALHQSFVNSVMERPCELRAYILMAAVAELRGTGLQEEFAFFSMMRRVTFDASDSTRQVH
jgi:hypothetical protein